jgi:hypothetical protein
MEPGAMPDQKQLQKVWLLSDTVLYREAVAFMRSLVSEQECNPLPGSQVAGLLNIAEASSYDQLERFIYHQRDRDWPPSRRDIKTFYTALGEVLETMYKRRLKDEFHLLDSVGAGEIKREAEALMVLLARDFIQHVVAENGRLAAEIGNSRSRQRSSRR